MDARELRDRLAAKEQEFRRSEFLAAYTERSKKIFVRVENVVCSFRVVGQPGSGFGVFKIVDGNCARFVKAAPFDLQRRFLDMLPKLHLILSFESDRGWVACPMNAESARKSLGLDSETYVQNVSDCERFDVITARYDGVNFWFDEVFIGADPQKSEAMRRCFVKDRTPQQMKTSLARVKSVTPEENEAFRLALASWAMYQRTTTEERIKKTLADSGATMASYVVRGTNIEVRWKTTKGEEYTSLVKKETLDVVSAGICLAGQDKKFHLKDLPYVIEEGEGRDLIYTTDVQGRYVEDRRGNRRGIDMD